VATGSGSSFGEALVNAIAAAAGGTIGVRRSYTAKGWHAQISKLTSSPRGYEAAHKAGLSVNHRTLVDWLAERREPSRANQDLIAKAYQLMAGRWPVEIEQKKFRIYGEVSIADDARDRGAKGTAPLEIDGSQAMSNDWAEMREAWESGEVDPDDFEDDFMDIIEADLGEFSDPPQFTGNSYQVVIV
jgi:hypothetical protein